MTEVLDRDDRQSALDKFSQAQPPREIPSMKPMTGIAERVIGAQHVAVYRDEQRVLAKLKTLAAAASSDWYYRFPVKNKKTGQTDWIEGPSIKLANDLARIYGNCEVDTRVLDLGDAWLFYARFTDFETGYSLTRPFQQYKAASRLGGGDDARRQDIAFQIGSSKAIRNVVVNALQTFADYAEEEAKQSIVEAIGKDVPKWRDKMVKRISELGVDTKRIERVVGRTATDWLAPDMASIAAMMKAINDGMATLDETFPPISEAPHEEKKPSAALDGFANTPKPQPDNPMPEFSAADAHKIGCQDRRMGKALKASPGEWRDGTPIHNSWIEAREDGWREEDKEIIDREKAAKNAK